MKLNYNQWLALLYGDIFDWPMTAAETKAWGIKYRGKRLKKEVINSKISSEKGLLFLTGRETLVNKRLERETNSQRKLKQAGEILNIIKKIPTIKAVFVTGSVAAGNAKKTDDIDLMIITSPGSLWLTRLLSVTFLRLTGRYKNSLGNSKGDKVCTNIFLDSEHLEVQNQNLYTAHEVLLAKCIWGRNNLDTLWLRKNRWTEKFLPEKTKEIITRGRLKDEEGGRTGRIITRLLKIMLFPLEMTAFWGQYLYMRGKITRERIERGRAFFHPRDLSKEVLLKMETRVKNSHV